MEKLVLKSLKAKTLGPRPWLLGQSTDIYYIKEAFDSKIQMHLALLLTLWKPT